MGFSGNILTINLTSQKSKIDKINKQEIKPYIGGKGYAANLLWEKTEPKIDPLSEGNVIILATGPLTATSLPATGRMCFITKSPLTNTYDDSHVGGHFASEMKNAGYDFIIINGKADNPSYLYIEDDHIEILDATSIWGKDVFETEDIIANKHGKRTRIASIGVAGENLVRYSAVCLDRYRHVGRGGLGAVMGSKNLKAIGIKGNKPVQEYDPKKFDELVMEAEKAIEDDSNLYTMKRWGTGRSVVWSSNNSLYPTRNFQSATFQKAKNLGPDSMDRAIWMKQKACFGCPIHCGHIAVVRGDSKYSGSIVEGVEYETTNQLGANCGIEDIEAVTHANMLCDKFGLDTISTGGCIAWAMECFEKGIINEEDTNGYILQFGNQEAFIEMIKNIAYRRDLGNLLAEGVKRASKKIGGDEFAIHVKGLELPGWGVRAAPSMGLAYATADRGGCHQRAWPISYDLETKGEFNPKESASVTKSMQDINAAFYSLVACDFATGSIGIGRYVKLLNAATGWDYTKEKLIQAGERIWNLIRMYNLREGTTKNEDKLPERFYKDPLPDGNAKGKKLSREDFAEMLNNYYKIRGWDKNGIPKEETLNELELTNFKI
ncbi:MAG: aldehyde ferredoxin oxidoreductase family protein [Petrotogales bacterium]